MNPTTRARYRNSPPSAIPRFIDNTHSRVRFIRDNLVTILTAVASIAISYGATRAGNSFAIAASTKHLEELDRRQNEMEARVRYMEQHGHEEHERRIVKLEEQKADVLANSISEQGKQISKLADMVKEDHDSIMKLTGALERDRR